MAISNIVTGEYLKITGFQADFQNGNLNIVYLRFSDAEQRVRFETGLSPYENYVMGQYNGFGHISASLNLENNEQNTIKESLLSACYNALKSDVFHEWIDC